MTQFPHCHGMMPDGPDQAPLCKPLALLKREHGPLREQMNAFAWDAEEIGADRNITDWTQRLAALRQAVGDFAVKLELHSEREEGTLFPLMANYIGRQVGPIAVMEYEHEQAKQNLNKFDEAAKRLAGTTSGEQAREIASYALQAHAVLTDHFKKEENVLFPMAEKLLSAEEKEELSRAYGLR